MEARAYHTEDLEEVRYQFLRTSRNPKVSLGGIRYIRQLTFAFSSKDGGRQGVCTVHRISKDADAIRAFYERLGIGLRYDGENVPHATGKTILSVLRPTREQLPPGRKAVLYAEQGAGLPSLQGVLLRAKTGDGPPGAFTGGRWEPGD